MRRLSSHKGLVASMEEEIKAVDPIVDTPPVPPAPVVDNAGSLETDMIDVADAASDVVEINNETAKTAAVVEALEDIALCLGHSAKEGGMDRFSAQAVGIATQALYDSVGLNKRAFPALESFGQTSSRAQATKIAMEDIKEQAKKVWDAIVMAVEKAIAWVTDFYNKVTDAAGKLQKRAEDLAKAAGDVKGDAKEKTISNTRVAGALGSSKGFAAADVTSATLAIVIDSVSGSSAKNVEEIGKAVVASLGNVKETVSKFSLENMGGGLMHEVNAETVGYEAPKEGNACFRSAEMLGGRALIGYGPKSKLEGEEAIKAFPGVGFAMGQFDPKAKPAADDKGEMPTLSGADAKALAEKVADLGKALSEARAASDKIAEVKKQLVTKAKALGSAAGNLEEGSEDAKAFKAGQTIAQNYARLADQPGVAVTAYAISTGKAALDYVELSLKQYGEAAKAATAEPATAAA